MSIKKLIPAILIGTLACVNLAGCTSSKDREAPKTKQELKSTQIESNNGESSKVLVVYYSASGNTKAVAENIAEETDGDLFELVPTDVYTSDDLDWTNKNSRVTQEHNNPETRDVELEYNTVDKWDDYDTVFIVSNLVGNCSLAGKQLCTA